MNHNNANNLLEQALKLLDCGFSVIPVARNKKPLIEWKQYQERKPTIKEVTGWWTQFPRANIGIITGKISDLIVVDIDPRHGGTDESFKNIKTVKAKSGGGGWHYYFKYEEGVTTGTQVQPGIDIRSEGGYIIAPPSMHSSGQKYQWEVEPE